MGLTIKWCITIVSSVNVRNFPIFIINKVLRQHIACCFSLSTWKFTKIISALTICFGALNGITEVDYKFIESRSNISLIKNNFVSHKQTAVESMSTLKVYLHLYATIVTVPFPGYLFISYIVGYASINFGSLEYPKERTSKSGFTRFI